MRQYWVLGWLVLLGIFWGSSFWGPRRGGPVFAGKTANQWLAGGFEDASMGLHELGPPAVPFVLAKLAREDPRYGTGGRYRELWRKMPPPIRRVLPKPADANFDELRACSLLLEIGPQIIPALSGELQNRNPAVRQACAHTLGLFREQNRDIRTAYPGLMRALQDPHAEVRARASWALSDAAASQMRHP